MGGSLVGGGEAPAVSVEVAPEVRARDAAGLRGGGAVREGSGGAVGRDWLDQRTPIELRGERVSLHHVTAPGPGGAPPLLLLHGMASSWRQWRTTLLRLGGEVPLCALDFPGFGGSDSTRRPLAGPDFVDACEAWCRRRGWPAISAVGHSFGGAVLVEWAGRHPERFRSLGLIAPASVFHPWYTAGYDFLRWPVLGPALVPLVIWLVSTRRVGRRVFAHIANDIGSLEPDEVRDLQWGCRAAREMRRALDYYRFPEAAEHLGRIRCPVLIAWGTHDRVVPFSDAAFYLGHLPDGHMESWTGCGHVPMMERRAECDGFLRRVFSAMGAGGRVAEA